MPTMEAAEMADTRNQGDTGGAIDVLVATAGPPAGKRRGLRITLLSLAVAILLLGAAVAGAFAYLTISHGSSAAAWAPSVDIACLSG
jgi:hypothetical protein